MPKIFPCVLLVAGFSIAACSESTAPTESTSPNGTVATPAQTSTSPQGVIPQAQLDALAKAAEVSNVLEQAEQERRKQMEAQGL